jgi:hypothetical protein
MSARRPDPVAERAELTRRQIDEALAFRARGQADSAAIAAVHAAGSADELARLLGAEADAPKERAP